MIYTGFMTLFIPPSINITSPDTLEWKHYAHLSRDDIKRRWSSSAGKGLLQALSVGGYSRTTLDAQVGRIFDKYDLRGIPLNAENLSGLDLSDVDFFSADLSGADLRRANLSESYLSECDVRGARFDWAKLDNTLMDNAKFDHHTCFLGVDLRGVNFTLATLLYDLALTQQRIQQVKQHYPIFSWLIWITCDYGRSFTRYLAWVLVFVVGFAVLYRALFDKSFLDCLYFSVVTFATVGYGDILPATDVAKIAVILEIVIGYLMGGLLIAILAKRVMG
jgi:hypothetical protein